jgi:hypothetical protein
VSVGGDNPSKVINSPSTISRSMLLHSISSMRLMTAPDIAELDEVVETFRSTFKEELIDQ